MLDYSTLPEFIPADAEQIIADANAYYESLVGKTLQPAQVEALVIRVAGYIAKLKSDQFNDGGRQQLIGFAHAPMLDYLVEILDVYRIPEQPSVTPIDFAIITGHTGVTIPVGTRVQSGDGKIVFATKFPVTVPIGTYVGSVDAEATTAGVIGNGYAPATVNNILDPQSFIVSAANTATSDGGADKETDDQLRERAKLAPNAFSVAGSAQAYKYHTLSAHPSIVDASVVGPPTADPGEVRVYPLVKGGGTTPTPVINAVIATLSADKVRPLCDTVNVFSPTNVDYDVTIALTLLTGADDNAILIEVGQALVNYTQGLKEKLGLDVVLAKLAALCMIADVYEPVITSPVTNVTVGPTEYANIGTVNLTIGGYTNG